MAAPATQTLTDARGRNLTVPVRPERIVSLVPSITESLFALGCGSRVVGITDYCVHPEEARTQATVVGGTHGFSLETVQSLKPDLVIANQEENPREELEALAAAAPTFITFPRTVRDGIELIRILGQLAGCTATAESFAAAADQAYAAATNERPDSRPRVLYLIWRKPWMAVNRDTYVHDMLTTCGALNVTAGHSNRYPKLTDADIVELQPDAICLSTEPYAFTERHRTEWLGRTDIAAARLAQVSIVDGELCSWYGTRIAAALEYLSTRICAMRASAALNA